MSAEHPEFNCLDCGVSTWDIDEFYMVHDELWHQAVPGGQGMLCLKCLAARLHRPLTPQDFPPRQMHKHLYRPAAAAA